MTEEQTKALAALDWMMAYVSRDACPTTTRNAIETLRRAILSDFVRDDK